mmetsp:Transcript_131892/g.186106  ORF Transcript_131892/g.186106 Transcript_131892/m.186106 type:complete len:221 (-) Transcript_131892:107-769(-)
MILRDIQAKLGVHGMAVAVAYRLPRESLGLVFASWCHLIEQPLERLLSVALTSIVICHLGTLQRLVKTPKGILVLIKEVKDFLCHVDLCPNSVVVLLNAEAIREVWIRVKPGHTFQSDFAFMFVHHVRRSYLQHLLPIGWFKFFAFSSEVTGSSLLKVPAAVRVHVEECKQLSDHAALLFRTLGHEFRFLRDRRVLLHGSKKPTDKLINLQDSIAVLVCL